MTLFERFVCLAEQMKEFSRHNYEINKATMQLFMDSAEAKFTKPEEFAEFLKLMNTPFKN